MTSLKTLRTCSKGHQYYKSSDCPVSPECEKEKPAAANFLALLSAPARRALEAENISELEPLATYRVRDILALHGIGKTSIPILIKALEDKGLSFKS